MHMDISRNCFMRTGLFAAQQHLPASLVRPSPASQKNILLKTMKNHKTPMTFHKLASRLLYHAVAAATAGLLIASPAHSETLFWDSNGTSAGAGLDPTGTWGSDPFWTTSSVGTLPTFGTSTTSEDKVNFSAGSDTTGAYTVTLNGTQYAQYVSARTGNLTLEGGTLALTKNTANGSDYLKTEGVANMTLGSNLLVDNSGAGSKYMNFNPAAGTTITINGTVGATTAYGGTTNRIFLRHAGDGTVIINGDLGADANLKAALNTTTSLDGVSGSGVLTLNGDQTLASTGLAITTAGKTGTVNLGGTVDTNNTVELNAITISHDTANLTGATVNINSRVLLNDRTVTVRSGGAVNVAGSLTTTGNLVLGYGAAGGSYKGGSIHILHGGEASVFNVDVANDLVLTNGGTLNAERLRLGQGTTSGKLVLGDATGTGTATFTGLTTEGTGADNAIVGGNSTISTFTLHNSGASQSFSGRLGGDGLHENNLELVKNGSLNLTLSGENTYVGNTTVHAGTLTLDQVGSLRFVIGASGVNNGILGTGTVQLDGEFVFDLSNAAPAGSWEIVDITNLAATFSGTFSVAGFNDAGGDLWTKIVGESTYTFNEGSGMLTAVPEPGTWVLLLGAGILFLFRSRRLWNASQPCISTSR